MALHLPIGSFKKTALGWSRYRDTNPVPTSPLADIKHNDCAIGADSSHLSFVQSDKLILELRERVSDTRVVSEREQRVRLSDRRH